MLPKQRRIKRSDFSHVLSAGKRYNSSHILAYIALAPTPNLPSRFSFSISKKNAPLAVVRNRTRRRGYAAINRHLNEIQTGYMCFFSFKKGSQALAFGLLEQEILEILSNAGVRK